MQNFNTVADSLLKPVHDRMPAIEYFSKSAELEPEYTKAHLHLGRSYLNLGKWFDAIPPLRTAYSLSPQGTKKEV